MSQTPSLYVTVICYSPGCIQFGLSTNVNLASATTTSHLNVALLPQVICGQCCKPMDHVKIGRNP